MKPSFALNLSHDGISLLHREKGGWRSLGEVALDDPDLTEKLSFIRRTAADLAGGQLATKLVIPNSQILFRKIDALGATDARREAVIRQALEGATPYALDEVEFAWCDAGAGYAHVAVVARETLQEAEAFAAEHRFNPVSFVAVPEDGCFAVEPFFGQTAHAATLLGPGEIVEPDVETITLIEATPAAGTEPAAALPDIGVDPEELAEIEAEQFENLFKGAESNEPGEAEAAEVGAAAESVEIGEPVAVTAAAADDSTTEAAESDSGEPSIVTADHSGEDPAPALAFSSRRSHADGSEASEPPYRLERIAPRMALTNEPTTGAPRLGAVSRDAEITPLAVTDPAIAEDDRPSPAEPSTMTRDEAPGYVNGAAGLAQALTNGHVPDIAEPGDLQVFATGKVTKLVARPRLLVPALVLALLIVLAAAAYVLGLFATDQTVTSRVAPEIDSVITLPALAASAPRPRPVQASVAQTAPQTQLQPALAAPDPQAQLAPTFQGQAPQPAPVLAAPDATLALSPGTDQTLSPGANTERTLPDPPLEVAALNAPEISADLRDLPTPEERAEQAPAQPIDVTELELTPDLAAQRYRDTGIWQLDPIAPIDPDSDRIDDLYVASIDPAVIAQDAVALPGLGSLLSDQQPKTPSSPAPSGTAFDLDERGLVRAVPEGAETPDRIIVYAGKPPLVPAPRPQTALPQITPAEPTNPLAKLRPRPRPGNLTETNEKSRLGGRTLVQLAGLRPRPRPASPQDAAPGVDTTPTAQAVLSSRSPISRPTDFARIVEKARSAAPVEDNTVLASAAVAAPRSPSIPTRADVAKQATVKNAIRLTDINLIGVYGSASQRRALIRLASGRYVKVQVGDKVDGGKVAAIGANELRYVKRGRNVTLKMPKG